MCASVCMCALCVACPSVLWQVAVWWWPVTEDITDEVLSHATRTTAHRQTKKDVRTRFSSVSATRSFSSAACAACRPGATLLLCMRKIRGQRRGCAGSTQHARALRRAYPQYAMLNEVGAFGSLAKFLFEG